MQFSDEFHDRRLARGAVSGSPGSGNAPAWASALTIDTWTALNNVNVLSNVYAADVGQYAGSGPSSVMVAWNGAAFASGYGASGAMIHAGGGHSDYYGTEVYAFDLATLTWARITEPYGGAMFPPDPTNGLWASTTPAAAHLYYHQTYRPSANEYVITRRESVNTGGGGVFRVSRLNLGTLTWANSAADHSMDVTPANDEGSVYDSTRDAVWLMSKVAGTSWARYDFSGDSWSTFNEPTGAFNQGAQVYVPGKDCVVFFTSSGSGEYGLDPAAPTASPVALTTSGTPPSFGAGDMAHWSQNLGAIVYYPSRGNVIYLLTAPAGDWDVGTWEWSQRSLTGTSGTHSGTPGTYGKFQVLEWGLLTVAVVNANVSDDCQAVRLN